MNEMDCPAYFAKAVSYGYKMFYEINHWTHTEEMVLCLGNPSNENNVLSNAFIE
jgi:hypothetical protein